MNKQELLDDLASKCYRIGTESSQYENDGFSYYLVMTYSVNGDNINHKNVGFFVENEGQSNESAFYYPADPYPTISSDFQNEVRNYIIARVSAGQIEGAFIETLNPHVEVAIANVVMNDLTETRVFVDRDSNGDIQHRIMI